MGLSGRKTKQRIGDDPRNLNWADDAARFGSSYLSKFGWDASKGLGAEGEGRISHIKVSQKLDMLGIGADHRRDPNGIAWKQSKDFENLLKRLNETQVAQVDEKMKNADESESSSSDESSSDESVEVGKKRKDRDREEDSKKKKKKKKKHSSEETATEEVTTTTTTTTEVVQKTVTKTSVVPRHRAHRARHIAAKNIASKASSHISEILGVAPTTSSSTSPNDTPKGSLTPISDELEIEKITTSTKSVSDYFKEKLQARPKLGSSPSSDSGADGDYEAPRTGLGASRLRFEASSSSTIEPTETRGLSAFSSLKSASLLASFSLASTTTQMSVSKEGARQDVEPESSAKIVEVSEMEEEPSRKEKKEKKKKDSKHKKGKRKKTEESEEPTQEEEGSTPPSTIKKEMKSKHKEDKELTKEERRAKKKEKEHKPEESSKKKKRKHSEALD